jgi:cytochrome c peroxidase
MKRSVLLHLVLLAVPLAFGAPLQNEPIQPVPQTLRQDPARAEIGARLFTDSRLSSSGRMSCASCHNIAKGGADATRYSLGVRGQPTPTNVPTVLNAALNFRQSWNGRAASLEAQIDDVMQNPDELGATWDHVLRTVASDPIYRSSFAAAYKDGVTRENIRNALASYQRTLITPNSRFDRYLLGDADAITPAEKAGYAKFKQYGCVACHQGVNVGGNMFQKFGVMGNYFAKRGNLSDADLGRFLVTKLEADKHVFKVPSLRNVARTAPYFHDGSAATLEEAVAVMFRYQLGRVATPEDRSAIVLFLNTLNGEVGEAR